MKLLEKKTNAWQIVGDNLEMLTARVDPEYLLFAEAGKMIYLRGPVQMESRMPERDKGGFLGKLLGAGKRVMAGESMFFTYFEGEGEVGFAGEFPGRILPIGLKGETILAQRDAFIAAMGDVDVSIAFQKRLGGGFFGGEGFILEKISGEGVVFIHAGGDLSSFELEPGESMRVDTGSVVAWDDGIDYDVQFVGGIRSAVFGGEGLFLTSLTGPGTVIVQTMTLAKLRRQIGSGSGQSESGGSSGVRNFGAGVAGGGILGGILGGAGDQDDDSGEGE
jgi:uncharacterized protein (TIGR00266 family)